tara:strand:- start:8521 stop:9099 length:579 start_codon:yes stop_codon:yes gene_type:complete
MRHKKILVACEESGILTKELLDKGHYVRSCDLKESSSSVEEVRRVHIQGDVLEILHHNWELVIAFPPCTHLSSSGARWFKEKREDGRQQKGIDFFLEFTRLECPYAIENPIGIMSTVYKKPSQIIQPWEFGHGETKATCLWLQDLPNLVPTNIVSGRKQRVARLGPSPDRGVLRSKTYIGIARAMADQWGAI